MTGGQGITEIVSPEESGTRLDRWVKRRMPIPQSHLEKLLRTGRVRIVGMRAKAGTRLETGMRICLPPFEDKPPPRPMQHQPDSAAGRFLRGLIVHEDEHMFVLNKPPGIAVQGGTKQGGRHIDGMLDALGQARYRPRLVHRLDKETSGLLVIAKNPGAAAHLSRLFRTRKVDKVYWAITVGVPRPDKGRICNWIGKGTGHVGREMMIAGKADDGRSRYAVTDYATITALAGRIAWVALKPQTGRMHQLRVHMYQCGASILGDDKYKTQRPVPGGLAPGLHLHARSINIPYSETDPPLIVQAPLPAAMQQSFKALGFLESDGGRNPMDVFG